MQKVHLHRRKAIARKSLKKEGKIFALVPRVLGRLGILGILSKSATSNDLRGAGRLNQGVFQSSQYTQYTWFFVTQVLFCRPFRANS